MNMRIFLLLILISPFGITLHSSGTNSFYFVEGTSIYSLQTFTNLGIKFETFGGIEQVKFNTYSPDLLVTTSHFKTLLFTDPQMNFIVYNIDEVDYAYYGDQPSQLQLNSPQQIKARPSGEIYVADTGNNRVLKFMWRMNFIEYTGLMYTNCLTPYGIAIDNAGSVYVADTGNNRVVKLTADLTQVSFGYNSYLTGENETVLQVFPASLSCRF